MLLSLLRQEVLLGDTKLLLGDIAADLDEFHSVTQSLRYGRDVVGRSYEENLAEVVVDVEVVVVEGGVLLGVKHLKQSRSGIPLVVAGELVDLIEYEDGIGRTCLLQALYDASAHSPDVGTAVSTDLGLVMYPTEGDTDILTSEALGDTTAEGGLTHPWRAIEAEDGRLHVALELEHG